MMHYARVFPSNHYIIFEFKGISFYPQGISFLQIS